MLDLISTQNTSILVDQPARVHIKDQSTWAVQSEERSEVSRQLTHLRKKHDLSKCVLGQRDLHLQTLKSELVQLEAIQETTQMTAHSAQDRVKHLEAEIEKTREMRRYARDQKDIYEHVLDRMTKTRISLELKAHKFTDEIKNKQQVVNEQLSRMRKTQMNSNIAKQAVEVARNLISRQEQEQEEQVTVLEKHAKMRKEIESRREERQTRQAEIAELAANSQKDSEETHLRQGYFLHRFWFQALHRKLQKDKSESVEIEDAFQQIKIATGLSDVHEMLERFFTKEQTYVRLRDAVNSAERRVERLKRDIEEEQGNVKNFKVTEGREEKGDGGELDKAIAKELREVQTAQEKLKKHEIEYDHMAEWVRKMYGQLCRIVRKQEPDLHVGETENYLLTLFQRLTSLVEELLAPIQLQRDTVIQTVSIQNSTKIEDLMQQSPTAMRKIVRVKPSFTDNTPEVEQDLPDFDRKSDI